VFLGGLSAATGMIIVETVALSTMVSNSLVLPVLLRVNAKLTRRSDLAPMILGIRRVTIVVILLLGYGYFRLAGAASALSQIGLVSFAAVAQFAPAILGGLFWKGGTRNGTLIGLSAGFLVWAYTLLLPTLTDAGWISSSFVQGGPFGIQWLRPQHLFGLAGMDSITNAMFWSALVNIGGYVGVSVFGRPRPVEREQAVLFVDALAEPTWTRRHGHASVGELRELLKRFFNPAMAERTLRPFTAEHEPETDRSDDADTNLVSHVETVLAGVVGVASARILVASVVGDDQLSVHDVIGIIDEASEVATLEERHRLARDLHDSVCQALFSMTLHTRAVELAVQKTGGDPDGPVARGLKELRGLTQGALSEMRASLFQLRPSALHEDGLAEAIRKQATAIATREGLTIDVEATDDHLSLGKRAEGELFRVFQEAVHNSIKHAEPRQIAVRLGEHPEIRGALLIEIADDGSGFDPEATSSGGMGLAGMSERMARIGGRLVVDSCPARSTTVQAILPGALESVEPYLRQESQS
jgi:signal transduction histidine kinase